jgi:predicted cupin superfamily sugar epimerase
MPPRVEEVIRRLALAPHPEGGFFRETFRAAARREGSSGGARSTSTAIYFLLPSGEFSAFHEVRGADEIWHHYLGDAVEIHTLASDGAYAMRVLGGDIAAGEEPQLVVSAGTLQAAAPRGAGYALCGCTVAPGFEFADFAMPSRAELIRRFPAHADVIRRLTRA